MGKKRYVRQSDTPQAEALLRNLRTSPRKLGLVVDLIRGLPVQQALNVLQFSTRRVAHAVRAVLQSAVANAENNHTLNVDRLVVCRVDVGRALVMRRFHARGRGRSARIEKWLSHLRIVVSEQVSE
jgi:large subunit ribosomal protein L22